MAHQLQRSSLGVKPWPQRSNPCLAAALDRREFSSRDWCGRFAWPHCHSATPCQDFEGHHEGGRLGMQQSRVEKRKESLKGQWQWLARRRRMRGMAIVEEEIPDEGIDSPPAHTLFTVPENWHPRSHFGLDSTPGMASGTSNSGRHQAKKNLTLPAMWRRKFLLNPPEQTRKATEHGATADTTQAQPPSVDGGYLNLIFEVRNLLEDQTFRIVRLEQRLDMFFAAHSRATPKKQCPTCARAYAFPARWRHTVDNDTPTGSEVT
jgi:hypothetical protein